MIRFGAHITRARAWVYRGIASFAGFFVVRFGSWSDGGSWKDEAPWRDGNVWILRFGRWRTGSNSIWIDSGVVLDAPGLHWSLSADVIAPGVDDATTWNDAAQWKDAARWKLTHF